MRETRNALPKQLACFLLMTIAAPFQCRIHAQRTPPEPLIVVHSGSHADSIARAELRAIFLGSKTTFDDGTPALPAIMRDGPLQDRFLAEYLGKLPSGYRAGWRTLIFIGRGSAPLRFDDDRAMLDWVAHTPGAIGFVERRAAHPAVTFLTVR